MVRKASIGQARSLRRKSSSTERYLWKILRDRRLDGLRFRRQVPMGAYVLDFVSLRHRLVVEADGPFHDAEHDAARDAWLEAAGFRVLRFTNHEIGSREERVIARILTVLGRPPLIGEI